MSILNKLWLASCLGSLVLTVACGNGSGGGVGFGGGGTSGSFSNSSLNGNFTYQITGYDLSSGSAVPFREAGAFVADGKGNITGGEDDFSEGTSVFLNSPVTSGNYSISNDGTGSLTLNFSNGSLLAAIDVQSAPTVYMAVTAPTNAALINGTGVAVAQTTSAFSAAPSGPFVFRTHSVSSVQGSSAKVGAFTVASGAVTAGAEDQWQGGALTQLNLTGGLFNVPDTFGRGTGTLVDSNSASFPFSYYMRDSSHFYIFSTLTTGNIGVGQAESQSGTFSNSSLNGNYVFGTRGDDGFSLGGVNTVGLVTASSGNITGGQFDSVEDGTVVNGTFSGSTYTVAANGRAVVNLAPSTGIAVQEILWLVSPSRAYVLTNDTTKVEDGTADLQQTTSFTNSSINGQFGFANDGFVLTQTSVQFYDRVGYLHWDGAGNLGIKEFLDSSGTANQPGILNGSYTMANNGRAVGNVNTLSSNLIFYFISNSQAYMLQGDTGVAINGMMGALP